VLDAAGRASEARTARAPNVETSELVLSPALGRGGAE